MPEPRIVKRIFVVAFALFLLAMIWPIYPLVSRIRPFVLGMPFSFFYLVAVLLLCFFTLALLYFWEKSRGELD